MTVEPPGRYGPYGGQFVAETLMPALRKLERAFAHFREDAAFAEELRLLQRDFIGRPTPLDNAQRLTAAVGGARILLKREDLAHTGAHKINNTVGQALLARAMGKRRLIAETGAGMHGVATATVAARFGLRCDVFMGAEDIKRQAPNVDRMRLLGAKVVPVVSGSATLKDAMNEALRDWVTSVDDTFYVIGTVAGPHPYPLLVREFQSVIGSEARRQCLDQFGRLPREVIACIGGGSNALGIFAGFLDDDGVRLVGVEAAGDGLQTDRHAASLLGGCIGVLHGSKSYVLQDDQGQILNTHSISAGLDYPGVGPEHAWLRDTGRVEYIAATDTEAVDALHRCCRLEGILPALESAHALAAGLQRAARLDPEDLLVINCSGRGDKDMAGIAAFDKARSATP